MSVTLIQQPQEFHPAYNQAYFVANSTNKTQSGFRYVVGVFKGSTKIAEYKLRPVPTTLYGEVDISKVLQSELTKDFRLQSTYNATGHFLNYTVKIDEEYFVNHPFGAYLAAGSGWANFTNPNVNPSGAVRTQIECSTEPPFSAGDLINVKQTTIFSTAVEGVHTVLDKYTSGGLWYLVLSLPWIGGTGVTLSSGVITYANGLKARFTGITSSAKTAWRGAFGFVSFPSFTAADYLVDGNTKKLLTTLPSDVRISRNIQTKLACRRPSATRFVQFNLEGDLYRYPLAAGTVVNFDAMPTNINITQWFNGSTWVANPDNIDAIIKDLKEYTVRIMSDSLNMSAAYKISLYSECDFFDKYDITFLDRLGSWITIPFYKADAVNSAVDRQELRRKTPINYTALDAGLDSYHIEEGLTYTVNSGQLSEIEYFYMRELLSTPKAFVSINGAPQQAITIVSSNIDLLKARTNKQRNLALQFTMATQDEING
jgi:hypothetical protein